MLLQEEKEPVEWRKLHRGAERGIHPEHNTGNGKKTSGPTCKQCADTICLLWLAPMWKRPSTWPPNQLWNTAFMANLDVKTACVAKPFVVWKIVTLTGVHEHLTAALLAEMQNVRGSTSFENSETQFRYSQCIRQRSVAAPVLCGDYPSEGNMLSSIALLPRSFWRRI